MAEKRRSGASAITADAKNVKPDNEEFLSQFGAGVLLRGALLKLVEARPEDPIGFLAEHFGNLASEADNEAVGSGEGEPSKRARERLGSALWHLHLSHHSQRSAFNNNIRVSYELLVARGGLRGRLYTELLCALCSELGLSPSTRAPLLRKIQCQEHEAVPFELFRQGILTCAVFSDYVKKSQSLYRAVCGDAKDLAQRAVCGDAKDQAQRAVCQAVLSALRDALDTAQCADSARYLEASTKIAPCKLAEAMALAYRSGDAQTGPTMDPGEFEEESAALFITRVRTMS